MNYYYYPERLKKLVKQYKENPAMLAKAFGVKNYSKLQKKVITDKNGHKKTVWVRVDENGSQHDGNLQKLHFSLAMIAKKLLSKFGIGLEKIKADYEEVSKSFDVDKTTFANHVYEYFSHKEKYDKLFEKKAGEKKTGGKKGGSGQGGGKKNGGTTGAKKERVKVARGSNNDKRLLRAIYKLNNKAEGNKKAPPLSTTQNKQKAIKFLDMVKPEIVELAKSAGLDIEGYKHKVTDDFARHVIKKHGNKKEEAKRGEIAVTQEDLDNIKTVMNTPDIVVAGVKKNGKDRIVLVKNTEHGSILVEEVLSGRRNKTLNAKTFWIMDKTVDEAKIQKILTNTNGYDVSKIKVASLTGTNSVLSSSKDEGGSNSAVKTATTKGQPNNRTVHTSESITHTSDSVNENKKRALKLVAQSPVTYKGKKWNVNLNSDGTLRLTSTGKNALGVYTNIDATTPEKIAKLLDAVEAENTAEAHKNRSDAMKGNQNAKKDGADVSENRETALNAFDNNAEPMLHVEYSRNEYNRLFPMGEVETPIGKVKLGEHQFERLGEKDGGTRKNLLGAMYQTLHNPTAIIDDVDSKGRTAKLYIKSFIDDDKEKGTVAVVVNAEGKAVSVSFGQRKVKQLRQKIKMASIFHYIAEGGSPTPRTDESTLPRDSSHKENLSSIDTVTQQADSVNDYIPARPPYLETKAEFMKKYEQEQKERGLAIDKTAYLDKIDSSLTGSLSALAFYDKDSMTYERAVRNIPYQVYALNKEHRDLYGNDISDFHKGTIYHDLKKHGVFNEISKDDKAFLEKLLTGEAEAHQNRSDAMKGNQNAKKDFSDLTEALKSGKNITLENAELGAVLLEAGETGKHGYGLKHIIEQRYAKDGKNADEISALCQLLMDTVRSGDVTRDNARTAEISKNGIVAIVAKEKFGEKMQWVLTGFDNTDTAEEQKKATDAIKTVIANNSYAQERSYFREQVGAVINSITPPKNAVNGKKKDVAMTQEEAYSNAITAELKKEKKKLEGYIANKTRNKRDHFNNIILRENYQKQLDAINDELAKRENGKVKPIGKGDFGDIYDCFKGKPKEAIKFLLAKKDGEAIGALSHKDIGDIDLVWGKEGTAHSDGFGLAKLAKYHPEVLDNLQEIIDDMNITKKSDNRIQLESKSHKASVKLTWNGKSKKWLLTAFEKRSDVSDSSTGIVKTDNSRKNDTATLTNTADTSSVTRQGDSVKKAWVANGRLYVNKAMAKKLRSILLR